MLDKLTEGLSNLKIEYLLNEPMSRHTTFKIGGNADVLVKVKNVDELRWVLRLSKQEGIPFFVIGKGSNLLVSDSGIEGIVISLEHLNQIKIDGENVCCDAGVSLMTLCKASLKASLSGLEFAFGIPGTVGGALYMNAGAYGGEMSQVVSCATALDSDGNIQEFDLNKMKLGYRTSVFKNTDLIILNVSFKLKNSKQEEIETLMNDFFARRRDKQPLEFPSAGSTFKRPEGYFAGALIEKNNLKGASVGGAEVSVKHAGFVINKGGATANDVKSLIKHIQQTVKEADGVDLEPEVIFVGRE